MRTKPTLIGIAVGLLGLFVAGCSDDNGHDYLEQQVRQALQDNNLSVWQVESLAVTDRQKEGSKGHVVTSYQFEVGLVLEEDLQLVRYADADARELVVTPGPGAGESIVLPGMARVEGEQTEPLDEGAPPRARISLPLTDLPAGLPASLLRERFADWQQIAVGSDAYQSMLDRLRRALLEEQRALSDASDQLRRARQQLEAQDEELQALEGGAGQSSEMGETMERASENILALMARVEQLQVEQYTREETVKKLRADLDHLQGS